MQVLRCHARSANRGWVWTRVAAGDRQRRARAGRAWVAELTGLLDLSGWPPGMRAFVRQERPHPGAQLRLTDIDGLRVTAFATNAVRRQLADLELRHRRRARCEDRIRCAKDTGLTNLPLHDVDQNKVWCAVVSVACGLIAWLQLLALAGHDARRWEPKGLRLRVLSAAGRMAVSGRRTVLHLSPAGTWSHQLLTVHQRLRALPSPAADLHPLSRRPSPSGPWYRRTERPRTTCHTQTAESPRAAPTATTDAAPPEP